MKFVKSAEHNQGQNMKKQKKKIPKMVQQGGGFGYDATSGKDDLSEPFEKHPTCCTRPGINSNLCVFSWLWGVCV